MFNSIVNSFRKPVPAAITTHEIDMDAEYAAYCRDMAEIYRQEQADLEAEWKSLTNREMREVIEWIDELNWRGAADTHRFYPQWKRIRCD